jgi:hypothetical protein
VGKPEGKGHLKNPDMDGRIILRWIFRVWGYGLDSAGSVQRQVAGSCIHGNELLDSIKCEEFLD